MHNTKCSDKKLSSPNPVNPKIREQYEEIILGRGTPRIDHKTGKQTIFNANELKNKNGGGRWEINMENQMAKYSLLDVESNLIVGTCDDIVGMTGECTIRIENEFFHKIVLENFQITQTIKEYCKKTKSFVTNIDLCVMDITGNPIGSYYFSSEVPLHFHKSEYEDKLINFELIGVLHQSASKEALDIWEIWRQSPPTSINLWSSFSMEQREGWLEVVRINFKRTSDQQDEKLGSYFLLDATYVTDSTSFFCAIGEAINGPGGYFGFDFMSLKDCLCGGYGAAPPFNIHLQNTSDFLELDSAFLKQLNEIFTDKQVKLVRL